MDIKDKVGIVTGGTGGIGVAIAKKLLNKGIKHLAIFDLETANSRKIYNELEKEYGNRVGCYPCDVTNKDQFSANFNKVIEKYKTVDILLNNAGIVYESSPELMIDINYKAVIMGTLMFIDRLGKHKGGKGGVVVNTASILGLRNLELPVYCSTKHAVVSFTFTMAEQFNKTGVRVVAICPGLTDTPLTNDIKRGLDFLKYEQVLLLPLQKPDNVGVAVCQLIETGKSGDVWVSEENNPPYAVKDVKDYKSLRIN